MPTELDIPLYDEWEQVEEEEDPYDSFGSEEREHVLHNLASIAEEVPNFAAILLPALQEGVVNFRTWGKCIYGILYANRALLAQDGQDWWYSARAISRHFYYMGNMAVDNSTFTHLDYYGLNYPAPLRDFLLEVLPGFLKKEETH